MRCAECRGACCEELVIPRLAVTMPDEDAARWFELHAELRDMEIMDGLELPNSGLRLACKCTKLTEDGRCGIYDERPDVCAVFPPGGRECLDVVRRRRSPADYQRIREDGDPEALDG